MGKRYFRGFIVYLLQCIYLFVGKIISFIKGQRNINLRNVNKITFNRRDRIGDAVVTKPFLLIFSEYLKKNGYDIELEVECSKYNSFIFSDCESIKVKVINTQIDDEKKSIIRNVIDGISHMFKYLFIGIKYTLKRGKNKQKYSVYVDLIGNIEHIVEKIPSYDFIVGQNICIGNIFLDYSQNQGTSKSSENILERYINLLTEVFLIKSFNVFFNRNLNLLFDVGDCEKKGILLFLGCKEYRNFDEEFYHKLINYLGKYFLNEKIVIIDDNNNQLYKKFVDCDFAKNVNLVKNTFRLDELGKFAQSFKLLIGPDGGGFNYIRTKSNSITMYTIGNSGTRSIYGNYTTFFKKNYNLKFAKCDNINYGYIYKDHLLLPGLMADVPIGFYSDFPFDDFVSKIKKILN